MSVAPVQEILGWAGRTPTLATEIGARYQGLVSDSLGSTLGYCSRTEPSKADELIAALRGCSSDELSRHFKDPRITHAILWLAQTGRESDIVRAVDTVLEVLRGEDRIAHHLRTVGNLPPVDLDSDRARSLDLAGREHRLQKGREPMDERSKELLLERLEEASDILSRVADGRVAGFVNTFTSVLVMQPDDEWRSFSSGTTWQHIGQVAIGNAHLAEVDALLLADAIVHESIHGLLYMCEHSAPWVLTDRLYGQTPTVTSPWSGRSLAVRPFLQACFVWYGLFSFWTHARELSTIDRREAESFRLRAELGFAKSSLRDGQLSEIASEISPEVLDAIHSLQVEVRQSH